MAVRRETFYIVCCDICGAECDQARDVWLWESTRVLAIEQAADTPGWTEVEGGIVCPVSDARHDKARAADSPHVLRPTKDAMTATFDDEGPGWSSDSAAGPSPDQRKDPE